MRKNEITQYKQGGVFNVPWVLLHPPPPHHYRVHSLHPHLGLPPLPPDLLPARPAAAPHAPTSAGHHIAAYCTAWKEGEEKEKDKTRMMQECNELVSRQEKCTV